MNAGVGPALFPAIQVGLSLFQTLEAQTFQRGSLRVADTGLNFAFAIWILDPTRHGDCAVVCEHIAVEGIERGIVDVGDENALAQIVENDDVGGPAESAESTLVQFRPDARTGAEGEQANRFPAAAQRHHKQPRAPVLAGLGIAHHRASTVIDLRFLAGSGDDHHAGFGRRLSGTGVL
jgi:hypothetical protein